MRILAIETSCDETSAAVVKDGLIVESSIIHSQIKTHQKFGGVVPEIASRIHAETITKIINLSLEKANVTFKDITAIAVTKGPGLEGALLIGQTAAKTLSKALNLPLIPVHHIHGHIYSTLLSTTPPIPSREGGAKGGEGSLPLINPIKVFPQLCLIISGGHTQLIHIKDHFDFEIVGQTRDDAVGECFDKVARTLGLGYPGGPAIQKAAVDGNPNTFKFPKPMGKSSTEFSFSGLKTAVIQSIKPLAPLSPQTVSDIAASFQQTVVDILVQKTISLAHSLGISTISIAGGVSANAALRTAFQHAADTHQFTLLIPPLAYTTDNAAMIATAAYYQYQKHPNIPQTFQASPNLPLSHPLKGGVAAPADGEGPTPPTKGKNTR
jgi:N6-L-threonylcarbamoyladenine synthase